MAKPTPEQAMLMMVGAVALVGIISILTMTTTGSQPTATQDHITGHAIAQPETPAACGMDVDCRGDQRCYCAGGLDQYQDNDCTCQD